MNNEERTAKIEELILLYKAAFSDASKYPAFSQKCKELDLPTYLNQQIIGCDELEARSDDDLRRRWTQTLDDRDYARVLEDLRIKQEKQIAAKAAQRRQKQEEALDNLIAVARSVDDMKIKDLQKWHSGKFFLFFGLNS